MSSPKAIAGRRRRRRSGMRVVAPVALTVALLVGLSGQYGGFRAAGQTGAAGEPTPQTDASIPATRVTMIGSSPAEATDETWGLGREDGAPALVRYTPETGWSLAPGLLDAGGQPLTGFRLDQPEAAKYNSPSPLAAQMTANGSGVLAGATTSEGSEQQVLLVRNPGGAFQETAPLPPEGEAALGKGERLLGVNRAPMVVALDESGGHAGALVVPVNEEANNEHRVLHWDGKGWTSEPIEIPAADKGQFQVLAIGASSPRNAWMLARLHGGTVALFRRQTGAGEEPPTWQPVIPKPGGEAGEPLTVEGNFEEPFTIESDVQSQVLTVTGEGVWIDGRRPDVQVSTTMFFKPEGELAGRILVSWCSVSSGAPACAHELPEPLPTARARSFAWANPSTPEGLGERVITGFPDGVSLRLDGTGFTRVLALGGSSRAGGDVGGSYGAAFSSSHEGWLGQELLPVHLTLKPVASRLTAWPASFRHALLALAPAPGQPEGSLSSEALAVGDQGEVARFEPKKGWTPESLLGPGGRHETPRLRAVAWPTATRAYAVGDLGQMWLWRGETGLWEADPATPLNFRGNLLGIAFDPHEPSRGYAVGSIGFAGQGGVLLSYGKTWSQEPVCGATPVEPCLPPAVAQASFTSIAFAGSEAIVAYRKLIPSTERYEGGLIVNDGSGWRIDEEAATAMGSNVPWAVAGLPDGGAAFTASGAGEGGRVYERQSAGSPWQETSTPFPGNGSPGTIAAFREGGTLRVVAAGSVPDTAGVESEPSPPPGFPPTYVQPYPLASNQEKGVLRQTSTGWSDEEHELDNTEEPPGEFAHYDTVYQPDPVAAVMVDSTGADGWAVGGIVDSEAGQVQMDTADVWRYPADGVTPLGVSTAPIPTEGATFAIGGGAQCAAPCADRAQANIGPDVWLSHALSLAGRIAGVRAFFYTGPRVTSGKTAGPASVAVPYKRELDRYAEILASSPLPAYAVASPTDLDEAHSEASFKEAFSGFHEPFGNGTAATGLEHNAGRYESFCAEAASCDYAMDSTGSGGTVRVIVFDDSANVEQGLWERHLAWLEGQLQKAAERSTPVPAIVIGNADLPAQIAANDPQAKEMAQALMGSRNGKVGLAWASAYFFDSPEQNVNLPLRVGSKEIPSFGSGTLGYVSDTSQELSDFIGASGFLKAQVGTKLNEHNMAPVTATLVPNIGELALEAQDGTLLRRSQAALFAGLARRPRSGNVAPNRSSTPQTDPYIPIPSICNGVACAHGLLPEYTFSSSRKDIGDFVKPNTASADLSAVLLVNGKPEADPQSGLFCAFNAGTTIVTISAGGLSAELPVTVQPGSVRQPCGTTRLTILPSKETAVVPTLTPTPTQSPAGAAPAATPLLPVPPPPSAPAPVHAAPPVSPFLAAQTPASFVPAFVPPPLPTPARPTPPSGTSAVTQPVEAPEREEEQEAAPESVSAEAVSYRAHEHEPTPAYILGIVVLAAFAGASARRRPGRRRREVRVAPATISSMRSQRAMMRNGRIR